ncbi:MAG: GNAT family N-acetyltransferase [Acidobacteriota bacterium]
MIKIRSLKGIDYDVMAEAFNDAFSDYAVPAKYTVEYLRDLVLRRGYRPDLAVGAFDGARLVGFVFNCLDGDAAYNSGTGTVISHRRRGIARQLMQRSIETLPAKRYILEVIETNERAAALYRDLGFVETRRVQCWTYDPAVIPSREDGEGSPAHMRSAPDHGGSLALFGARDDTRLELIRSWYDVAPAWQNEVASIRRANEPYAVVGDERGAAVVFPSNGDVPLLAVAPEYRRKGIGRALLEAAAATAGKRLRIMNIDDRDAGIAAFLEKCGAQKMIRQIEMVREL